MARRSSARRDARGPSQDFVLESAWLYVDMITKDGGYKAHVKKHRRILTGLVKKALESRFRSDVPDDVASHALSFWTPPGGY